MAPRIPAPGTNQTTGLQRTSQTGGSGPAAETGQVEGQPQTWGATGAQKWARPVTGTNAAIPVPVGAARQAPTGPGVADALVTIATFFGTPALAKNADKIRTGSPEKVAQLAGAFSEQMRDLRDDYSKLKNNPAKAKEFNEKFGTLERQLAGANLSAEEFFQYASAGPEHLAARIGGARTPQESALFTKVGGMIERISDEELEHAKAVASNSIAKGAKDAVPAGVDAGHQRAVSRLVTELGAMAQRGEITASQQQQFMDYGISRLNAVKTAELDKKAFPVNSGVAIGSAQWKQQMDELLPPERTNQTIEVFSDGVAYHEKLTQVIDEADSKLFVSLMKTEPDRAGLKLTDDLSVKVRTARGDLSSLAIINRIAAKKLEMPYEQYMDLRMNGKMEAKDIRDLRLAQKQLELASPGQPLPDIRSKEVAAKVKELQKLPDDERKRLVNETFTKCDVKVVLDGKFAESAMIGSIHSMVNLAIGHSPVGWLRGTIEGSMKSNAKLAGLAAANHLEPGRYAWEGVTAALGAPLRDIEDKANFMRHPIRYAFGAPRDLEDIGIFVNYENKIFDKGGVHPGNVLKIQHEKVVAGKQEDGTLSMVTSGNNIGAKHFPYERADGVLADRFHDAGMYVHGGKGSVVEDILQYEVTQHWNDAARDPQRDITPEQAKDWLASSDAVVGSQSARMVNVNTGHDRNAVAAIMAGFASSNKQVTVVNPFFSGDDFIKQAVATADRWKREGWDPSKPFDPNNPEHLKDPTRRELVVVMPGWLDGGIAQAGSFKAVNTFKEHGIKVVQWRPGEDTPTPDGRAVYDKKAMLHTKAFKFMSVDDAGQLKGFVINGSINAMNPVFTGASRELGVYSEDPSVIKQFDEQIFLPDIANSVEAKRQNPLTMKFDQVIGIATKLFQ